MSHTESAFSAWCLGWYRRRYGDGVNVMPYSTRDDQRQKGDVRLGPDQDGRFWNYDEKAYSSLWKGCLVELLQESKPGAEGKPESLGWFYDLAECHYLLCGYFDPPELTHPAEVYRVSLRRLRAHYVALMLATSQAAKAHAIVSRVGYGITVAVVIPWKALGDAGCVETLYRRDI